MVAWYTSSPAMERQVDFVLKEEAIISTVLIQTPVKNSWGLLSPTTIVVYLSSDGIVYEEVARSSQTYPDGNANQLVISSGLENFGNAVNARVGVICPSSGGKCGLIEVEFFGLPAPTPTGTRSVMPINWQVTSSNFETSGSLFVKKSGLLSAYDSFAGTNERIQSIRFFAGDISLHERVILTDFKYNAGESLHGQSVITVGMFPNRRLWVAQIGDAGSYEVTDEFVLRIETDSSGSSFVKLYKNGAPVRGVSIAVPGGKTSLFASVWLYEPGASVQA